MSRNFLVIDPEERPDVLHGLASPARVRILRLLHRNAGVNVNDIAEALGLPQSTVSSNLQVLEQAGLIRTETQKGRKGHQKVCFAVFDEVLVTFRDDFNPMEVLQLWLGKIRVMIDHHNGPNPRKVSTPTAVISVRGTVFDVTVEDDDGTTLVAVEEGLVGVKHQLQPGDETLLRAGTILRVFPNQPIGRLQSNPQGAQQVIDAIKRAAQDAIYSRPGASGGGVPAGAGGTTTGGANGDAGKKKGTGPGGAPPGGE